MIKSVNISCRFGYLLGSDKFYLGNLITSPTSPKAFPHLITSTGIQENECCMGYTIARLHESKSFE